MWIVALNARPGEGHEQPVRDHYARACRQPNHLVREIVAATGEHATPAYFGQTKGGASLFRKAAAALRW